MSVSLKKPIPTIREITPLHLIDEEESIKRNQRDVQSVSLSSADDVIPQPIQKVKLSVATSKHKQTSSPTYTKLVQDNRLEHLNEVFRIPTEQELLTFDKIRAQLIPDIKKIKKCEIIFIVGTLVAFASFVGALAAVLCVSMCLALVLFALFALSCMVVYRALSVSPYDFDAKLYRTQTAVDLVRTISETENSKNLFVCDSGADTRKTEQKMEYHQHIGYVLFRPSSCINTEAFKIVTKDKHDVFMLYDEEYKLVICIDPLLFELEATDANVQHIAIQQI